MSFGCCFAALYEPCNPWMRTFCPCNHCVPWLQPVREAQTEADALAYIHRHRLGAACEQLLAALLFASPPEPLRFIAAEASRLSSGQPSGLFTETDLRALFDLHDPAGSGKVSRAQLHTAMASLGLKITRSHDDAAFSHGSEDAGRAEQADISAEAVTVDSFVASIQSAMMAAATAAAAAT